MLHRVSNGSLSGSVHRCGGMIAAAAASRPVTFSTTADTDGHGSRAAADSAGGRRQTKPSGRAAWVLLDVGLRHSLPVLSGDAAEAHRNGALSYKPMRWRPPILSPIPGAASVAVGS